MLNATIQCFSQGQISQMYPYMKWGKNIIATLNCRGVSSGLALGGCKSLLIWKDAWMIMWDTNQENNYREPGQRIIELMGTKVCAHIMPLETWLPSLGLGSLTLGCFACALKNTITMNLFFASSTASKQHSTMSLSICKVPFPDWKDVFPTGT